MEQELQDCVDSGLVGAQCIHYTRLSDFVSM